MKRLVLLLVLLGGGGFLWYAYHVGWAVSPLKNARPQQSDSGRPSPPADGTAPPAQAANNPDGGSPPAGRRSRQAGDAAPGSGRFGRGGADNGPIPVVAVAARYEDVPITVDAVGTIQALNTVTIRSQVDGRLLELDFKDGQDVKRGDVLARIDPVTYQAQYDQAIAKKAQDEAQLANARVDLERYTKLATTEYGSRQQADTQKALVAQLEAQTKVDQGVIDNDLAILGYTTIKSPIDGRTGIRLVDAGNIIHAADATGLVVITQLQPIAMIFNLPQQQLGALNAAMAKAAVAVEALDADNTTVLDKGTIEVVDNQVDQTTGTVKVKATFANSDRHLWPGQFVNVRIFVATLPHAVVVPTAAVQRGPNGPYCYVVNEDGSVKLTLISVGRQDETSAVVKSGLEPPTLVVTTGFARLTDGAHVTMAPADQSGAPAAGAPPATGEATPSDASGQPRGPDGGERRRRGRSQQQSGSAPVDTGAPAPPAAATATDPPPAPAAGTDASASEPAGANPPNEERRRRWRARQQSGAPAATQ
ncbi:MAG: efflux RND transporter periplasmic adaptor subunit [Methylobacteriaceae bacterium]|nr:efflux RND transporter periplasmic adaptor subunit [Methylobacteriaceae bacterium]